ncbi:uncharacterized protein LOC135384715 [Ornithodoros turicata]|uniref:uncharacterized protein LOC135384715 n=1 Tax=Ornithodoros turicata TaxID=34597 RepID=UPI003139A1E3
MDTAKAPVSSQNPSREGRAPLSRRSASATAGVGIKVESPELRGVHDMPKVLSQKNDIDTITTPGQRTGQKIVMKNAPGFAGAVTSTQSGNEMHDRKTISEPNLLNQDDDPQHLSRDLVEQLVPLKSDVIEPMDIDIESVETFRISFNNPAPSNPSVSNISVAERTQSVSPPPPGVGQQSNKINQSLREIRRKLTLETVTKTVIERKESEKVVSNRNTGLEEKDAHVASTSKVEEHSKRNEEVIESYGSKTDAQAPASHVTQAAAAVASTLFASESVDNQSFSTATDMKETAEKAAEKAPEELDHASSKPILRIPSTEAVSPPTEKKLGFQGIEDKPEQKKESTPGDDDDDIDDAPPPRLNFRRKDSIAVTKLRMMKAAEEGPENEDEDEEEEEADDDKKHPIFKPPTVIDINEDSPADEKSPTSTKTPEPAKPDAGAKPPDSTKAPEPAKPDAAAK